METTQNAEPTVFDFRMDLASWGMILAMVLVFAFYFLPDIYGSANGAVEIIKNIGIGALLTFILIAVACIPVILLCYFIKQIPDIDYSVWVATAVLAISVVINLV